MAYLMQIAFDNTSRLQRNAYLFEYKGVRFKLVQDNPRKWADHLMTIIPKWDSPAKRAAYAAASEFLSALAWVNGGAVAVWDSGGGGWRDGRSLRSARPTLFLFPRIPWRGGTTGYGLSQIAHIQTEEQRVALALLREARASNNDFLSFLFYWQVLDVGGGNPERTVNDALRRHRRELNFDFEILDRLPLAGRPLGRYLLDDCRHAIAHIRRRPGRRRLDLDDPEERKRLAISVRVMEYFAEYYIRHKLRLSETLSLVRPRSGGFPRFVDRSHPKRWSFVLAYPPRRRRDPAR